MSRRAKITPERAGLPAYGANRRVQGLDTKRWPCWPGSASSTTPGSNVAIPAASLRTSWKASPGACSSTRRSRAHLFDLVHASSRNRPVRARPTQDRVRPAIQRILDSMVGVPAYVRNGRLDILATNRLGAALYSPVLAEPTGLPNTARFIF